MRGIRNDFKFYFATHLCARLFVQIDDDVIVSTDNQERGRLHRRQGRSRQIGTPATRDDRADVSREFGRSDKRSAATRARSKVTKTQVTRGAVLHRPLGSVDEALGQQANVEPILRSLNV